MRTTLAFAAALAVLPSLASPAEAAPSVRFPAPVAADTVGLRLGVGAERPRPLRLYGSRIGGGYHRTVYETVYIPGGVRWVDAFGRVHRHPGHYEQRPTKVWVHHTVVYPRPHWRGTGYGLGGAWPGS